MRTPNLPLIEGPQDYIPVDAALPSGVNFGPRERAQMVKESLDICEKKGVLGSGYIPKTYQTTCTANSKGLFAYYQYAEAGFILTCRTPDGSGSGWAGITGIKDISMIDATQADGGRRRQGAQEPEAARARARTLHRDSRAARQRALPLADDRHLQRARRPKAVRRRLLQRATSAGTTKPGDKLFSDLFTLKSDIGNSDPAADADPGATAWPASPVTWVEKGVLKNLSYDRAWAKRQKKEPTPVDEHEPGAWKAPTCRSRT